MKYPVSYYAKALVGAILDPKADQPTVKRNFMNVVHRNGDEGKLSSILEEAIRLMRGAQGVREVIIESARPLTKSQEKMIGGFLKSGDVAVYRTDSRLIAGVKVTVNDEQEFDGSMQRKLHTLFGGQ